MIFFTRVFFFISLLLTSGGPLLAYYNLSTPFIGISITVLGLCGFVISAVFALFCMMINSRDGKPWFIFILGPIAGILIGIVYIFGTKNQITDFSSDTEHPVEIRRSIPKYRIVTGSAKFSSTFGLVDFSYRKRFKDDQKVSNPEVKSKNLSITQIAAYSAVVDTLKFLGWSFQEDASKFHIEAEIELPIYKLIHDFAIEIREMPGRANESQLVYRSRTRENALSDFSLNIYYINTFLSAFTQKGGK